MVKRQRRSADAFGSVIGGREGRRLLEGEDLVSALEGSEFTVVLGVLGALFLLGRLLLWFGVAGEPGRSVVDRTSMAGLYGAIGLLAVRELGRAWTGGDYFLLGSAAVLVLAWILASFAPGPRLRPVAEWIAAMGLYGAIGSFLFKLLLKFWADGSLVMSGLFGFLTLIFTAGATVSLVMTFRAAAGRDLGAGAGAVH